MRPCLGVKNTVIYVQRRTSCPSRLDFTLSQSERGSSLARSSPVSLVRRREPGKLIGSSTDILGRRTFLGHLYMGWRARVPASSQGTCGFRRRGEFPKPENHSLSITSFPILPDNEVGLSLIVRQLFVRSELSRPLLCCQILHSCRNST